VKESKDGQNEKDKVLFVFVMWNVICVVELGRKEGL
jgi:hypothetical protein